MVRTGVEAETCEVPERVSLRWLSHEEEYEGDFLGDVPVGGYRRLVNAMRGNATVRLGAIVTAIDVAGTVVSVRTADGAEERGSHVVCTLPLGVLKAGAVRFSPELPADRQSAIERLSFGHLEKVVLTFETPFWRSADIRHLLFASDDTDAALAFIIGQDAFGSGPALVCLVQRSSSDLVLGRSPEAAVRWVLDMVEAAIGGPCPNPTAIAASAWANDPYARGSYTHYLRGSSPADVEQLAQPLFGRLLSAGEATSVTRIGYADGAMQTGIREAKRLLGQPAVLLAPD